MSSLYLIAIILSFIEFNILPLPLFAILLEDSALYCLSTLFNNNQSYVHTKSKREYRGGEYSERVYVRSCYVRKQFKNIKYHTYVRSQEVRRDQRCQYWQYVRSSKYLFYNHLFCFLILLVDTCMGYQGMLPIFLYTYVGMYGWIRSQYKFKQLLQMILLRTYVDCSHKRINCSQRTINHIRVATSVRIQLTRQLATLAGKNRFQRIGIN